MPIHSTAGCRAATSPRNSPTRPAPTMASPIPLAFCFIPLPPAFPAELAVADIDRLDPLGGQGKDRPNPHEFRLNLCDYQIMKPGYFILAGALFALPAAAQAQAPDRLQNILASGVLRVGTTM